MKRGLENDSVRRSSHRIVAASLLAISLMPAVNVNGDEVLDAVVGAWKRRQQNTRSLVFEWTQNAKSPIRDRHPGRRGAAADLPIGAILESTQDCSLRVDVDRFDLRQSTRDGARLGKPIGSRSSFNGRFSQDYSGDAGPGTIGTGIITSNKHEFGTDILYVQPLLLAYRPFHPSLHGIAPDRLSVTADQELVGAHRCRWITNTTKDPPFIWQYAVDPDNDWIVRRLRSYVEGREYLRVDMEYRVDPTHGPVLASWHTYAYYARDGALTEETEATVMHSALNVAIPASEFHIVFPKNAPVEDRRAGSNDVASLRSSTNGERTVERWRALLVGNIALGIVAVWYVWYRRRNGKNVER